MEGENASLSKNANCANKEDIVSGNSTSVVNTRKDEIDYVGQRSIYCGLLKCHDCGKEFANKEDLIIHTKIHYGPSDDDSNLEETDTASEEVEDKGANGKRSYEGNSSNKEIRGRDDLEKPVEIPMEERESKGTLGKKEFDHSSSNPKKRKKGQVREKSFKCDLCKEMFSRSKELKKHEHVHKIGKYFKCSFCSMGFIESKALVVHLSNHERKDRNSSTAEEDLFQCKFCPSMCTWDYLKKHETLHSKELQFLK